ncbi:MAG: amidohydrolase [Acidimicrobiales bacterium]
MAATALTVNELKADVCRSVDAFRDETLGIARQIWAAPEPGFKEHRTSRFVQERFAALGLRFERDLAITGVKAVLEGGAGPGPTVAVMGELDSLVVWEHPDHDQQTGAVHACGHNAQVASMLGVGRALIESGALAHMAGRVVLFAVPAEEFIEIEDRLALQADGKLEFLSGKAELLRLGALDGVDMAMMVHANTNPDHGAFGLNMRTNGMVGKFIRYVGHATHAGHAPDQGHNALYAAHVALTAINSLRETFRDDDHVRVHPIITRGGDAVSAIPADVRMETFVRAATADAIAANHIKIDRALRAGAMALGITLELTTVPGYLPLDQDPGLTDLFRNNASALVGRTNVVDVPFSGASTDMGDLGHVIPVLHPFASGSTGHIHGRDFRVSDEQQAIVDPTKAMVMTVVDLLADNATTANAVLGAFRAPMTKQGYLSFARSLASKEVYTSPE